MKRVLAAGKGLLLTLGMFTVLPLPYLEWDEEATGWMLPCMPFAGLTIGALWASAGWMLGLCALPPLLYGAVLALAPMVLSGGLHLDGFLDCADALLSRRDLPERLRILKDSHVGAFGVVAFGMLLVLYVCAGGSLAEHPPVGLEWLLLAAIPVLSRTAVAWFILRLPALSPTGYLAMLKQKPHPVAAVLLPGLALAVVLAAVICWGAVAAWATGAVLVSAVAVALLLNHQFGGFSGDLCGCTITVAELCGLLALVCCQ
ncbi:MAG: adenosylcobinamide-GDP ribazoletransferase [Angelakisella sp.]